MRVFSIAWQRQSLDNRVNCFTVRVTCLQEDGQTCYFEKVYEDWFGVCTNHIESVCNYIRQVLPGISIRFERLGEGVYQKVLPYFEERLKTGKLNQTGKPFYKVYVSAPLEDVGTFLNMYKISYYVANEWLDRIYIDFSTHYHSESGFFYKWYNVNPNDPNLVTSFHLLKDILEPPNWTIAAFDLETVHMLEEDRIPNGMDPADKIVMISIVKWNSTIREELVLYLNPCQESIQQQQQPHYREYMSEKKMLHDFHMYIQDCHIITGYNINKFDFPCIFARLLFLGLHKLLKHYRSQIIGKHLVTTFQNKLVLDAYTYFQNFSSYGLDSLKLDNVAKTKLEGVGKVPVDAVGIHVWYKNRVTRSLCVSQNRSFCYETLQPPHIRPDRFGTFQDYLYYCLQDSHLVYQLFQKEMIIEFLLARSNFGAFSAAESLYLGNSRIMLEVMKTFSTIIGFFVNIDFFQNRTDCSKFPTIEMKKGKRYQGALNYCIPQASFENVAVLDFTSMYPACVLSSNLCYGTCTILTREEYAHFHYPQLTTIPYREQPDSVFQTVPDDLSMTTFHYPVSRKDEPFLIVINQQQPGCLPTLISRLLTLRKHYQNLHKQTKNVIHYNIQLCIKILVNSMYGTTAAKDSPLGYIVMAMSIVSLARYQLLSTYHYVQHVKKLTVCYADTDSLMVQGWPTDDCDEIDTYLNMPHVSLKFEKRMKRLLILSKKRYVYLTQEGKICMIGFQRKANELTQSMTRKIVEAVINLDGRKGEPTDGWILWVDVVTEAFLEARDPLKHYITRKTKKISEYKSKTCVAMKILQKYPEKEDDYIDYTYNRADMAEEYAKKDWVMQVSDCRYADFEPLFINQKRALCLLLNIGFWQLPNCLFYCSMVLNTIKWKRFVNAELRQYFKTGRHLEFIMEGGVRYTFRMNNHLQQNRSRGAKKRVT